MFAQSFFPSTLQLGGDQPVRRIDGIVLATESLDFARGLPKPPFPISVSVYVPVLRNALPEVFKAFDFADPSMVTGERTESTTPQQALFFMNDPFVLACARQSAARLLAAKGLDDERRVELSCRMAFGRLPSAREKQHALDYLHAAKAAGASEADAWSQYWQTLFASLDFRYLD